MTNRRSSAGKPAWVRLALLLAAVACEKYPVHDLGYTANSPPDGTGDPNQTSLPVAEFLSEFVEVWIGAAEDPFALQSEAVDAPPAFRFPSGSTRIRLELMLDAGEVFPGGTITFGDAPPPPLATDPDVGYPIDAPRSFSYKLTDTSVRPAVEGFVYQLYLGAANRDVAASEFGFLGFHEEGRAIDGKLELGYTQAEVFSSWCVLQTEQSCPSSQQLYSDNQGSCFLLPDLTPIDCLKAAQCSGACTCSGDSCRYSHQEISGLTVRFSDDGLVGLFSGAVFLNERGFQQPLGTVRFERETLEARE